MRSDRVPLARCRGVARTYGRGESSYVALHSVDCELHAGDHVALTGRSGSGKSTLILLLAGLDTPTAGVVEWPALGGGRPGRGAVAVVFQGQSLLAPLDAAENVALALLLAGAEPSAAEAAAEAALARLGIADLARRLPEELSGGQAQRVAVARALARAGGGAGAAPPRLLLADEPTGQLDSEAAAAVLDALVEAADAMGAALVVGTHDEAVTRRLRVRWRLDDGRLLLPDAAPCSS